VGACFLTTQEQDPNDSPLIQLSNHNIRFLASAALALLLPIIKANTKYVARTPMIAASAIHAQQNQKR
jgi:hypothetical protein